MNILEKVQIKNLWGKHTVSLTFPHRVNFLIGPNGSGKTAIINLVVAVLTADHQSLRDTSFSRIEVKLKESDGRRKPSILVEKGTGKEARPGSIFYKIRSTSRGKWDEYSLDDYDGLFPLHTMDIRRHPIRGPKSSDVTTLRSRLNELYDLTWLSIHRSKSFRHQDEEGNYDSLVDKKLMDMANQFVRFFSALSQDASNKTKEFQETVFLSLLMEQSEQALVAAIQDMDLEAEKSSLTDIYAELNVASGRFKKRVDEHFQALRKVHQFIKQQTGTRISAEQFAVLITNRRVHHIVQEWNKVTKEQADIFEQKTTFLKIVNALMPGKELYLNNKNELSVRIPDVQSLRLTRLSSGEKQMLIILGEALLQQKRPSIYIADEPELSLHVEWQETLIDNILSINPNAQIVFATHSPDIVGRYSEGVCDVREVLT